MLMPDSRSTQDRGKDLIELGNPKGQHPGTWGSTGELIAARTGVISYRLIPIGLALFSVGGVCFRPQDAHDRPLSSSIKA